MTPGDGGASGSLAALSAAAIAGGESEGSANHIDLQRAQRTVRPAAPKEVGSIAYDVEQFGQTISMGSQAF
jgi:hypothetical protein